MKSFVPLALLAALCLVTVAAEDVAEEKKVLLTNAVVHVVEDAKKSVLLTNAVVHIEAPSAVQKPNNSRVRRQADDDDEDDEDQEEQEEQAPPPPPPPRKKNKGGRKAPRGSRGGPAPVNNNYGHSVSNTGSGGYGEVAVGYRGRGGIHTNTVNNGVNMYNADGNSVGAFTYGKNK